MHRPIFAIALSVALEASGEELRRPDLVGPPFPLQPSLLAEADYRAYPSELEGNTGFALGRLRPGLVLHPTPWFLGVVAVELAREHPEVLDAFARFRPLPWVEFSGGYSRPPMFGSFYDPVHIMPFPDLSPVVNAFRVRRDLGVDVHVAPRTVPIDAWIRLGNGTGSPLGNDNALPALYLAADLVLGRTWTGNRDGRTFGLRLGASTLIESSRDRDGITGTTPLGFVYYRPNVVSGLRVVSDVHFIGVAGPVRATFEGAYAHESRSRDDDGNPATPRTDLPAIKSYGLTAELAWTLLGRPREVARAPQATQGPWRGGALELAARFDRLWLGRGANDVVAGGTRGCAVAVKWWPAAFLSTTLAAYTQRYDTAPIEEPNNRWSWGLIARASFFWGLPAQLQRPLSQPETTP